MLATPITSIHYPAPEPYEVYALQSQQLSQELYDDGMSDGVEGNCPQQRGSLDYLQGYADGCRIAFELFKALVAEFERETAWVDEF